MKLGIRLLFVFFVLNGILAFFVLRVFSAEIKPSVREVMEDMMVDTANILAELATEDVRSGQVKEGAFAKQVMQYAGRPIDAKIWGFSKQSLDFRIYVTDVKGIVLFDSENVAQGQDYSKWRDVARTLRGEYGARATREVQGDDKTAVMYVAAPVLDGEKIIGVLTVAKPISAVQDFIDRAERKVLVNGLLLIALSALVGVIVTLYTVWNIRKLRRYAQQVGQPVANGLAMPQMPNAPGELGDLARAMQAMRERLEGRDYIENHVRALTHELKSPVAAIRASGELLEGDLLPADRQRFAAQVVAQSQRLERIVAQMLHLSRLEQQAASGGRLLQLTQQPLYDVVVRAIAQSQSSIAIKRIAVCADSMPANGQFDSKIEADLLLLAISNLLDNAIDFSPAGSTIHVQLSREENWHVIQVQDTGCGVPDYALPRLGERFFSTPRPNGERSGSGLGLAIVREIMRLHGGQLRLANTSAGFRAELLLPI
ncbi:two-component system sensor histidine kinase CreC [Variovorax sp. PCZ-1]|uniref:two-component system sensor histidine kinase CreC n=1 Tax=Variovorax sp. PCZ-1 TaxID=2835533 RepID=UPI001BCFC21E|nr:two-component system sensor histidine kinase CreC [Variovorax sp. PCZ-1]